MSRYEDEMAELHRQEAEDRIRFNETREYFELEERLEKSKIIKDLIDRIDKLEAMKA